MAINRLTFPLCLSYPEADRSGCSNTKPMTRKEYNGWTNYETWNVKLWIDNDQGSQDYWNGTAEELLHYRHRNTPEQAIHQLSERLKEEFQESMPDLGATCYADLLNAAMEDVNWYEIASTLINETKERLTETAA